MLGYISSIDKEILVNPLLTLDFLIGEYDVITYSPVEYKAWVEAGNGTASYILDDKFLVEEVEIFRNDNTISMRNTIGQDFEKETFYMQTLDNSSGIMDIYKGDLINNVLIFSNIGSTINKHDSYLLNFKFVYKQLSELENELIIGCSRDNGKTWFPFLKNHYRKKFNGSI